MAESVAGLRHWEVRFDATGAEADGSEATALVDAADGVSDLMVFSHGWNNDAPTARRMYAGFFAHVAAVLERHDVHPDAIGTAGVVWPSMRWPDESMPVGGEAVPDGGGAASLAAPASDAALVGDLKRVFDSDVQLKALDDLAG
ncbi:MAG: hypothetical protein ACRDU8_09175, partial [Egibacteraceae bacterium]